MILVLKLSMFDYESFYKPPHVRTFKPGGLLWVLFILLSKANIVFFVRVCIN